MNNISRRCILLSRIIDYEGEKHIAFRDKVRCIVYTLIVHIIVAEKLAKLALNFSVKCVKECLF